jgi:PAS domain S-box-containing protein
VDDPTGKLEDLMLLAFDASPAAMFMVDGEGTVQLANAQCEQMFGFGPGEMAGVSVERLIPVGIRGRHRRLREDYNAAPAKRLMGVGRDLRALRRDGGEFPVEIGLTPVATPDGMRVVGFAIDISTRLESEARLKASLAELKHANESLAQFAFVASHDIQEPLRKISAFGEILSGALERDDKAEQRYAAEVMTASARRARALVADLLALARSHNSEVRIEEVPLGAIIAVALDALSGTIEEKNAEVDCVGDDFPVRGDRAQTAQVVQNLLSNALKYHKPGQRPRVRLKLERGETGGRLIVEDDGIGFPASQCEEVFEPFRRLHAGDGTPGSGIGLAICQTIANRHGWRIAARSAPGEGARFELFFPHAEA